MTSRSRSLSVSSGVGVSGGVGLGADDGGVNAFPVSGGDQGCATGVGGNDSGELSAGVGGTDVSGGLLGGLSLGGVMVGATVETGWP